MYQLNPPHSEENKKVTREIKRINDRREKVRRGQVATKGSVRENEQQLRREGLEEEVRLELRVKGVIRDC